MMYPVTSLGFAGGTGISTRVHADILLCGCSTCRTPSRRGPHFVWVLLEAWDRTTHMASLDWPAHRQCWRCGAENEGLETHHET